ncbi:unnamed protein product [Rotaria sp. Silwood2]|nr:unnamed protein product [Rotaria sp. Silwood2]CAF2907200.1 unnamed protein product [Rotaria sp. Silwood2]CAF4195419.1 unnamed protein product [Rotaria sp. Silwood2]CAF4341809.1 unnamed protein product [Rotaria sp. Silwood2]
MLSSDDCVFNTTGEQIWIPFTPLSKDCLYLNMWISINDQQEPLAVMVWFYGEGFVSESSTLRVYDGSILSSTQNVAIISIEYRVEFLGFLYLDTPDAPDNQDLFDQQLALEWIYRNLRNFGDDTQRIRLFADQLALESYNSGFIGYTFVPTIDADFIPYDPEQIVSKRDFKRCSISLAVNKDEGTYFNVYIPYENMSIYSWSYVDYKTFQHAIKQICFSFHFQSVLSCSTTK